MGKSWTFWLWTFFFVQKWFLRCYLFSCDWKKTRFFIRIVSKQFQCGFLLKPNWFFSFFFKNLVFFENSVWTFFKFGCTLYQEICKFCLKNTLQCSKGFYWKKSKPKYSEILEYFSWFFHKKTQIKHPTKI